MTKSFILALLAISALSSCSLQRKDEKNVLNVYSFEIIPGLDPMLISDRHSHTAARQIYEGLYEYSYDVKKSFNVTPVLADGMPNISDNGHTYTIKLKKGAKFADDPAFKNNNGAGRELTAQDFIYSIKRVIASPLTKTMFFNTIMTELVVGMDEFKKSASTKDFDFEKEILGMKALDNYTIQFKLKKKSAYFPGILTRPTAFVVPREAVEKYGVDFKYKPVGSGPFKIQEWEKSTKLVLVRNPNYKHGVYKGEKIPFLDKVVRYILVEEQPRWINFNKGLLDVVVLDKDSYYDAFPIADKLAEPLQKKGIKVIKTPQLDVSFYCFNMTDELVGKNKYLRQAISTAYDGKQHSALFFNNQASVMNWILPPGIFGFDPAYKNPYRQFDIDRAKKLLSKAGYPNGKGLPTLKLLVTDSIAARQMGEFFVKSMDAIGIKVELVTMNFGLLLHEVQNERKFHMVALQWRADLPFAEDFLRSYYSKAFTPGPNNSNFKNAQYDKIFEKMDQMPEGPQKLELIKKLRDISVEEAPLIPLVSPVVISLTQPYVYNYHPHVLVGDVYKYVKIDTNEKDRIQKKFYR